MILEFPEFLPDLPALNNPGMTVAQNVIPSGASYQAVPELEVYSNALDSESRGAISARDPETAITYNFTGTQSKLYLLGKTTAGTWDDVSRVGGYNLGQDERWSFTQFGDNVLAMSINTEIQKYEMGVDAIFSNITGGAPLARYGDTVKDDFFVVGNTYDAVDGFKPYRVRWPGIGTFTSWTISPVTQADFQDLNAKYGWVQAVLGGNYGVIFQERAIVRMDYIGSPAVFQFTTIEVAQGTKYPLSAIRIGDLCYFVGLDGFRVFDGNQSVQIGVNKVDKFFFDDLNPSYDYLISTAVDYSKHVVMWAYPSKAMGLGAVNSRILFYNYSPNATKRWSYANITTEAIFTALSEGYTLDQLDDWESANGLSKNIDILPYSLDSRVWVGNNIQFGAFNSDHRLAFSSTVAFLDAVLETAEAQITDGQKTEVFMVRPVVDNADFSITAAVTMQIGTRNLLNQQGTWGTNLPVNANGECDARANARYHRVRVNITGGFKNAIGVELLEFKPSGYR